jgi:hypothetical protein
VLLNGCVSSPGLQGQGERPVALAGGQSRTQREVILQTQWSGRTYDALVAVYGPPRMLMRIPGDRPNESVAVYGVRDRTSGCIDAFTVFHGRARTTLSDDSVVTSYFCR